MNRITAPKTILFNSFFFLLLVFPAAVFGQSYVITDLGSNAWSYSEAHALNGLGSAVGEYESTNFFYVQAFLYDNGKLTDLGNLRGTPYAVAYGINDASYVVGESDTAMSTHAFVWTNGTMSDLGTLGGNIASGYSSAHAINRSGQIVGESSMSFSQTSTIHAALFNPKTDLGALGGNYSSASALNNFNIIVGESDIVIGGGTNVHAFVYTNVPPNPTMHDLGTLGGGYSSAKGVNDSGVIVGEAETVSGGVTNLHAFVYRNGGMTDLGTLGGSTSSASAINNAGQIVGYATDINEVSSAFLYDGGQMINLNNFIPPGSIWTNLTSADAINDSGQIAGSGYQVDGSFHGYLLTLSAPLTVTITNPNPNIVFQAPATLDISASVSDTSSTVTNVQFLVNGVVAGNATSVPYSVTVSNLSAGSYILTAIASDATASTATNSITLTVAQLADFPPTVSITNPAPNATFQAPASFAIAASAADSDGTVTNVQFLVNGNSIGNATSAPYSATANNLSAGTYTLNAVASDNAGLTSTNSITVNVTDAPPTVAITNPAPNATFLAPASFSVAASASDQDATVTNVQFLVNSSPIGNAASAPYSATVNILSAGNYTLTAIASDNAGLNATNSIGITVTSSSLGPITLLNPTFNGTRFSFSFATQTGFTYQGQFATPLVATNTTWITFTNLSGNGSVMQVTDFGATNTQRFYRVQAF